MSTDVNWGNLKLNGRLRHIVLEQLQIFIWRYRAFVMRLRVRFSDVNGPKGGLDKRCRVTAKLRSTGGEITIQSKGMDYREAFQSSFERLIRSLQRETAKQRQKPIRINRRDN